MSVVYLRSANGFYGAERVIVTSIKSLVRLGVDVSLLVLEDHLTHNTDLYRNANEQGISVEIIRCHSKLDVRTLVELFKKVRNLNAMALHSHDLKSNAYGLVVAELLGIRAVATLHGWTSNTTNLRAYEKLDRQLLKRFDQIVIVSEEMNGLLKSPVLQGKVTFIPNGVDTEIFNCRRTGFGKAYWGIPSDRYVFGTFARFTEEKGHLLLLEAFAKVASRLTQTHLLLVGDGSEKENVRRRSAQLELGDRVTFVAAHDQVDRALHDLDCYVSPSHTEGMPMIILEAMASGLPIIATEVGAIGSMFEDTAGITVPANDPDALASKM
ncbi:MAG: glycosyltransferase family 4 protein, partial [Gammaproteobacteria bacterium]|nr:glycosyltransferase family 4 protein [Gammaproteobacteria bacterium]